MADQLNAEQSRAATHLNGPVLVRAGAGAGKTRVLTNRAASLLGDRKGLLFVTFTKKASEEMRGRLSAMLGQLSKSQSAGISTMHSFVLGRIIRPMADIDELGVIKRTSRLRLARMDEQQAFSESAFKTLPGQTASLVEKTGLSQRDLESCMTVTNANAVLPEQMSDVDAINAASQVGLTDAQVEGAAEALPLYAQAVDRMSTEADVIDFDQILLSGMQILSAHPDVARTLRDRFPYIQVDEFQDTNFVQLEIVKAIAGKDGNCCAVGDDRQAIYGFRGAGQGLFSQYLEDFPTCTQLDLRMNYRSSPTIVDAANACARAMPVRNNMGAAGDMQAGRRMLQPAKPEWWKFKSDGAETDALLDLIEKKSAESTLVLYRSRYLKSALEDGLKEREIDYDILEDKSFFEQVEVKWALDLVRAAHSSEAKIPWLKTIGRVKAGLSEQKASELWEEGGLDAIRNAAVSGKKQMLEEMLAEFQSVRESIDETEQGSDVGLARPGAVKKRLISLWNEWLQTRLRKYVQPSGAVPAGEAQERVDNRMRVVARRIDILYEIIQRVWWKKRDLKFVLENIEAYGPQDSEENADLAPVVLSTVHSAKGLEADLVIYIAGGDMDAATKTLSDEERRVFYVGITRPRKSLVITECEKRPSQGAKRSDRVESPFMTELGDSAEVVDRRNDG